MENKGLVLVDFDGTLYKGDSLIDFTKFYHNKIFYNYLLLLLPKYLLFKIGLYNSHQFKEIFLEKFFKKEDYRFFCKKSNIFSNKIYKKIDIILLNKLIEFQKLEYEIYIVTASFSEWILPWASLYRFKVISSNLEVKNDKISGKILGKNCNYKEKVIRIKEEINLDIFNKIYVFGNGKGDFEMMQLRKNVHD